MGAGIIPIPIALAITAGGVAFLAANTLMVARALDATAKGGVTLNALGTKIELKPRPGSPPPIALNAEAQAALDSMYVVAGVAAVVVVVAVVALT